MNARLRTLRLARGLSLDALAERMGGMITKMSLSRYERGIGQPSGAILERLAEVLGVPVDDFSSAPPVTIQYLGYRRKSKLGRKEEEQILTEVRLWLEQRFRVQEVVMPGITPDLPRHYPTWSLDDAERAAHDLRRRWDLGTAPIRNLIATLEGRLVHVFQIESSRNFDGVSAQLQRVHGGELVSAGVVCRRDSDAERQRMTVAHELGHLVLTPQGEVNEEKACYRFAGAFLAPAEALFSTVGRKRENITYRELMLLREQFGVSIQGLLYRLHALQIINDNHANHWWRWLNKRRLMTLGSANEPEHSRWMEQMLLRTASQGLLPEAEARGLLGLGPDAFELVGPKTREDYNDAPAAGAAEGGAEAEAGAELVAAAGQSAEA